MDYLLKVTGSHNAAGDGLTAFDLAMIPEPSTGLLVFAGLLGLAGWRRVRE